MNVFRRYFRITEGPLIEALKEAKLTNDKAHEEYLEILEEMGAKPGYYQQEGRLVGIVFDKEPDRYLFKKVRSGWMPKRNTKKAKALSDKVRSVKTSVVNKTLKTVKLANVPMICANGKGYYPTLVVIPHENPVAFVSVPWHDVDPDELKKYITDKAAGNYFNSNMDTLLWEPTKEMVEIKEWEQGKAIDEWNESVRG